MLETALDQTSIHADKPVALQWQDSSGFKPRGLLLSVPSVPGKDIQMCF